MEIILNTHATRMFDCLSTHIPKPQGHPQAKHSNNIISTLIAHSNIGFQIEHVAPY